MERTRDDGLFVVFVDANGNDKTLNVLTDGGQLMTNRIRSISRHHAVKNADPEIGTILLKKLVHLRHQFIDMQEINRTTQPEVAYVRRRIDRNEKAYLGLFKSFPSTYESPLNESSLSS